MTIRKHKERREAIDQRLNIGFEVGLIHHKLSVGPELMVDNQWHAMIQFRRHNAVDIPSQRMTTFQKSDLELVLDQ